MKYICFVFLLIIVSCKPDAPSRSNLTDLDLMKHGLPIKIKSPENPVVTTDDLGFVQDVTVKGDGNYYIQILGGTATTTDVASVKATQLEDAKNAPYFSSIIEEDSNGFIFEKKYSEDRINYDFRYVKIQGDKEYVFQTGLIGTFTLDEVKTMYDSVK